MMEISTFEQSVAEVMLPRELGGDWPDIIRKRPPVINQAYESLTREIASHLNLICPYG